VDVSCLRQTIRWQVSLIVGAMVLITACSGPDEFGSGAPTQVPSPTTTPTEQPSPTPEPAPTSTLEPSPTPSPEPAPSATSEPEPENTPTPEVEPTPEPEPTSTSMPTPQPPGAMESLPTLEDFGNGGYVLADQGERSAEQLASAYVESSAHLQRLEDWGFQQHVYREFTRTPGESDAEPPRYVLATINVYGSPEQAAMALQWLERLQLNQGAASVDPPELGEEAVAVTVRTSQGEDTASVYIRSGDRTYIYYAQGDDPLPMVLDLSKRVFERLRQAESTAGFGWQAGM
jgi:hypothetical protein